MSHPKVVGRQEKTNRRTGSGKENFSEIDDTFDEFKLNNQEKRKKAREDNSYGFRNVASLMPCRPQQDRES